VSFEVEIVDGEAGRDPCRGRVHLSFARKDTARPVVNMGWLVGERVLNMVIGLPVSILVARSLGPEAFGHLSYAVGMVYLAQGAAAAGLQGIVVRDLLARTVPHRVLLSTVFFLRLLVGLALWAVAVVTTFFLAGGWTGEVALVALVGFSLVTQAFVVVDLFNQASERLDRSVKARMLGSVTDAVAKLSLVLLAASVVWFGGAIALAALATAGGYMLVAHGTVPAFADTGDFSASVGRALLSRSWFLSLSGLGAAVYLRLDQVMLRHMRDAAEVGVYSVGANISEIWLFLPAAAVTALFPALLASRTDPEAYRARMVRLFGLLFAAGVFFASVGSIFAPWFFQTVYGDAYSQAAAIFSVYAWGVVFLGVRLGVSRWLIMEDLLQHSLTTHMLGAATNIGLNLILIPRYGPVGAAFATVASYFVAGFGALLLFRDTRPVTYLILRGILRSPVELLGTIRELRGQNRAVNGR
jgi:O-antigen/teichoic acid export membrane protein